MREIPFLDLYKVNRITEKEIEQAALRVIKSGWYILGEECVKFEKAMAEDLGGGFAAGCNSGTDAIVLSLKSAGVVAGDEVITVSHTAIPTVSAIVSIGAKPVFADIDPDTWVMDINKIGELLTERTKAVVPVHLYGNMVDIIKLKKILKNLKREDIVVIEDCAQAQGAKLENSFAGTLGEFGAYSFYPSKNIGALGDGGAVFTKREENYEKLQIYRNYGQRDRYNAKTQGGLNSRLDEIQAAILSIKLSKLHEWNRYKQVLMELYREELSNLPLKFQTPTENCNPAWHLCVIALDEGINRDELQIKLKEAGVGTLIHYPYPVHTQDAFKQFVNKSLPYTENLAKRIISLPFNYAMTENEVKEVSQRIRQLFQKG